MEFFFSKIAGPNTTVFLKNDSLAGGLVRIFGIFSRLLLNRFAGTRKIMMMLMSCKVYPRTETAIHCCLLSLVFYGKAIHWNTTAYNSQENKILRILFSENSPTPPQIHKAWLKSTLKTPATLGIFIVNQGVQ